MHLKEGNSKGDEINLSLVRKFARTPHRDSINCVFGLRFAKELLWEIDADFINRSELKKASIDRVAINGFHLALRASRAFTFSQRLIIIWASISIKLLILSMSSTNLIANTDVFDQVEHYPEEFFYIKAELAVSRLWKSVKRIQNGNGMFSV